MRKIDSDNIKENPQFNLYKKDYKNFNFEKNIVTTIIEKFLPFIFWLGFAFIVFNALTLSSELFKWSFIDGLLTFCKIFIPYSIVYIIVFYILFLLKDIRDSLKK